MPPSLPYPTRDHSPVHDPVLVRVQASRAAKLDSHLHQTQRALKDTAAAAHSLRSEAGVMQSRIGEIETSFGALVKPVRSAYEARSGGRGAGGAAAAAAGSARSYHGPLSNATQSATFTKARAVMQQYMKASESDPQPHGDASFDAKSLLPHALPPHPPVKGSPQQQPSPRQMLTSQTPREYHHKLIGGALSHDDGAAATRSRQGDEPMPDVGHDAGHDAGPLREAGGSDNAERVAPVAPGHHGTSRGALPIHLTPHGASALGDPSRTSGGGGVSASTRDEPPARVARYDKFNAGETDQFLAKLDSDHSSTAFFPSGKWGPHNRREAKQQASPRRDFARLPGGGGGAKGGGAMGGGSTQGTSTGEGPTAGAAVTTAVAGGSGVQHGGVQLPIISPRNGGRGGGNGGTVVATTTKKAANPPHWKERDGLSEALEVLHSMQIETLHAEIEQLKHELAQLKNGGAAPPSSPELQNM